jgi:hypothetical protein
MRPPELQGVIRRRILVNFRAEPEVVRRLLPAPFNPKLHGGHALVGICLIRLEAIRPSGWPAWCGLSSENAAHRIAVEWENEGKRREGVFVPRRHTGSRLNQFAGGRLFPGEQQAAEFTVKDTGGAVRLRMQAKDGQTTAEVVGNETDALPANSCFASLAESSAFFAAGSVGYSTNHGGARADGLELVTDRWTVRPLQVEAVTSSFFDDRSVFPASSISFDHALIMRDIPHRWKALPDIALGASGCCV